MDTEAMVYSVISPETGPDVRLFLEEDIQAFGGVRSIERDLEKDSYWFARLGLVRGELGPLGITFDAASINKLFPVPVSSWNIGRRNPVFRGSDIERHVFRAIFQGVELMLESWELEDDGTVDAHALAALNISAERLTSLTVALQSLGRVHELCEVSVIKYWYDPGWPEPHFSHELVLSQFSLRLPVQVRWSVHEELVCVEVMQVASC